MNRFAYVTARSPESAVTLLGDNGAFLAGGIDLLGEMKERLVEPDCLVNVKTLPGTDDISCDDDAWVIGGHVKLAAVVEHADLAREVPALVEAAREVGSPQMRNIATVAGNLAQHSRCWYYRHHDVRCLKKGGALCFARVGESRYHALFSGCACISPLVSNLAVALSALDATVEVQRGRRVETLPIADVYQGAWNNPRTHHGLERGDLILRIRIPVPTGRRSTYLQTAEKGAFDWALVSCAAAARVEGRTLHDTRIAVGVVAPIPWRVTEAERMLEGQEATDELIARAAERIVQEAVPRIHNAYKIPMTKALVARAITRLVDRPTA